MAIDDDHAIEDTLERRCAECGVELTRAEILAAREAGGPFLCTVHAEEVVIADDDTTEPPAA